MVIRCSVAPRKISQFIGVRTSLPGVRAHAGMNTCNGSTLKLARGRSKAHVQHSICERSKVKCPCCGPGGACGARSWLGHTPQIVEFTRMRMCSHSADGGGDGTVRWRYERRPLGRLVEYEPNKGRQYEDGPVRGPRMQSRRQARRSAVWS